MMLSVDVFAVAMSSSMCNEQRQLQSVLLDDIVSYKRLWMRSGFLSRRRRHTVYIT